MAAYRLADLLTSSGRPDEALPYYETAEQLVVARNLTDRESLRIRGLFELDTARYQEAEHTFALYANEFPDDPLPLFYRASALFKLGRNEQAQTLLDEAVKRKPDSRAFLFEKSWRALTAGNLDESERWRTRLAAVSPGDLADRLGSAIAFGRLNLPEAWNSLEHMRTAGSPPFRSLAYQMQACFQAEVGKTADALKLLYEGLRLDRQSDTSPDAQGSKYCQIAQILISTGQLTEAVAVCQEGLKNISGLEFSMQIGCALARAKAPAEAAALMPKSSLKWPSQRHWAFRLRGEIALARGDASQAVDLMRNAPLPRAQWEWPAYLVRAAIQAGQPATVRESLEALFLNPGRYWYMTTLAEPGFVRWALRLAENQQYQPTQPGARTAFRALAKSFQEMSHGANNG